MDTASVLIGVFFLLLFIFPLGWITYKQFSFQKKYSHKIKNFGREHQINFDELEVNHWSFLGIDQNQKILAFGSTNTPENIQSLSIPDIQHSKIILDDEHISKTKDITIKLSGNFGVKEISFYKDEADITADAAVHLYTAKKWLSYIQKA